MTLYQITCTKHPEPLQDKVWFSSRVITDVTFTWLGLMRKEHGIPGSLRKEMRPRSCREGSRGEVLALGRLRLRLGV